jgi:hypothetical protein
MATYKLIETVSVGGGGAASMGFTSIPQTFTDLQLVYSGRGTSAVTAPNVNITFNGTTAGYSTKNLWGNGSAVQNDASSTSFLYASASITGSIVTASVFGNAYLYIANYAGSTFKSVSMDFATENNATLAYVGIVAGLWSNTDPIDEILLTPSSGTFVEYSSASIYGIKN